MTCSRGDTVLAGLTTAAGGLPLLLYASARLFGALPAEDEWYTVTPHLGIVVPNHGPWYESWQGLIVFLCMGTLTLLLAWSGLLCILAPLRESGRGTVFGRRAVLALGQLGLLLAQLSLLAWTID